MSRDSSHRAVRAPESTVSKARSSAPAAGTPIAIGSVLVGRSARYGVGVRRRTMRRFLLLCGTAFLGLSAVRGGAGKAAQGAPAAPPAAAAASLVLLPGDLVFDKTAGASMAVVFRHETHVEFAAWRCSACHPSPFHMLEPTHASSHEVMNAGGSCGACHDGRKSFGVQDDKACGNCHV